MNDELLRELNVVRREQGIDKSVFEEIVARAIEFKEDYEGILLDSDLEAIITEAMTRVDNRIIYEVGDKKKYSNGKTTKQAFEEALRVLGYNKTK